MGNRSPVECAPSAATESLSGHDDVMEIEVETGEPVSVPSTSRSGEVLQPSIFGQHKFTENVRINWLKFDVHA